MLFTASLEWGKWGGGGHTRIHMCMLICLVCAARIAIRYRGTIFNVIGLLTGLKDGLEPRMVLYQGHRSSSNP